MVFVFSSSRKRFTTYPTLACIYFPNLCIYEFVCVGALAFLSLLINHFLTFFLSYLLSRYPLSYSITFLFSLFLIHLLGYLVPSLSDSVLFHLISLTEHPTKQPDT